jgi:mono/diheme cytochrome c family protein
MTSEIVLRVALLAGLTLAPGGMAGAQPDRAERGRALVSDMCGSCHAVGKTGPSPNAAAPPLRQLDTRVDLDAFTEQLREGLQSTHPDMPSFRFSRADARAVVAYLRSIQGP